MSKQKYEFYGQDKDDVYIDYIVPTVNGFECFIVQRQMFFRDRDDLAKWLKEHENEVKIMETRRTECEDEPDFPIEKETVSIKAFIEYLKIEE